MGPIESTTRCLRSSRQSPFGYHISHVNERINQECTWTSILGMQERSENLFNSKATNKVSMSFNSQVNGSSKIVFVYKQNPNPHRRNYCSSESIINSRFMPNKGSDERLYLDCIWYVNQHNHTWKQCCQSQNAQDMVSSNSYALQCYSTIITVI